MNNSLIKENTWVKHFTKSLSVRDYVAIKAEKMQALQIIVFTKREHLFHVTEVATGFARTGLLSIWVSFTKTNSTMYLYGRGFCYKRFNVHNSSVG